MANLQVANTILAQLGGAGRLGAMVGAHSFVGDERSLTFRIKARAKGGIKAIKVTLDPSDTYSVRFVAIRGTKVRAVAELDDVHAENLRECIEHETGLVLSLGTCGSAPSKRDPYHSTPADWEPAGVPCPTD